MSAGGRLRVRLFVDGKLADEQWLDVTADDHVAALNAVMVYHGTVVDRAAGEGKPWLVEVYDPGLPEGRAYMRMGNDSRGMRSPVPLVSEEQLQAEVERRYGGGG